MRFLQHLLRRKFLPREFTTTRRYAEHKATSSSHDRKSHEPNEPILFLGSGAASWRARDSRSGGADDVLWYQPYVVCGSVAAFLIYFCVLREENDIDQKLERTLFDHISGLEEVQLIATYKYNKENNLDTKSVEKRLSQMGIDIKELDGPNDGRT